MIHKTPPPADMGGWIRVCELEVGNRLGLHPIDEAKQNRWMMIHQDLLDAGKIEELVSSFRSLEAPNGELAEKVRTEAAYFGQPPSWRGLL